MEKKIKKSSLYDSISFKIYPTLSKIGEINTDKVIDHLIFRGIMTSIIGVIMVFIAVKDTDPIRQVVEVALAVGFIIGGAKTAFDLFVMRSSRKERG